MIRALDRWLPAYLLRNRRRPVGTDEVPIEVFVAVCDHFEPFHDTDKTGALRAMEDWERHWPAMVDAHRDSSGRGPRHTFFYPIEQYDSEVIERLANLCARTGSEVEVHLHHENDTADTLKQKLLEGIGKLASHGLFSRDKAGGLHYGFIHGNWALDHSHPLGKHCGVPDELSVLKATGCYADFTLPSAPDPSQVPMVNSTYYAREDGRPCSHARGIPVRTGHNFGLAAAADHLLIVQGPLGLNWHRRKFGLMPRVENGDLTGVNPPTLERFRLWSQLCPTVLDGPPWIFVKLHTHGGIRRNYDTLLGDVAHRFHREIGDESRRRSSMRYHYVTAREMVNLIHAAESGSRNSAQALAGGVLAPPPNQAA